MKSDRARIFPPKAFGLFLLLLLVLLPACAGFEELKGKDYQDSARLNFLEGKKYLKSENFEVAEEYFNLVKQKFSFSMHATDAELLLAEALYRRDMYGESIDAFRLFQRNHPNHECNLYAQYRVGLAFYEQMPEDWWFMPPAYERDHEYGEKARSAFKRAIRMERARDFHFPKKFVPEEVESCKGRDYLQVRSIIFDARNKERFAVRRLIDREIYVAEFYMKRDKPNGAIGRLEEAFQTFDELAEDRDMLRFLADAYREAHMYRKARSVWDWTEKVYGPGDPGVRKRAESELDRIDRHEKDYLKELAKKEEATREEREFEKAMRKKHGVMEIDPDPDPDASSVVPLPDPNETRDAISGKKRKL